MEIFNYIIIILWNFSFLVPILVAIGLIIYLILDQKEENRNRGRLREATKKPMCALHDATPPDLIKTDINTATVDEIAQLPGMNLILAKKLVEQRIKVKYFNNIDEIVDLLDLKPHVRKQLLKVVEFSQESSRQRYQHRKVTDSTKGRVVDF